MRRKHLTSGGKDKWGTHSSLEKEIIIEKPACYNKYRIIVGDLLLSSFFLLKDNCFTELCGFLSNLMRVGRRGMNRCACGCVPSFVKNLFKLIASLFSIWFMFSLLIFRSALYILYMSSLLAMLQIFLHLSIAYIF